MATQPQETDWTAVIARSLGYLCLHQAKLDGETLVRQADFLQRFGIPRGEAAVLLGSSEESLRVMDRRQAKKTTQKKNTKKTTGKKSTAKKTRRR